MSMGFKAFTMGLPFSRSHGLPPGVMICVVHSARRRPQMIHMKLTKAVIFSMGGRGEMLVHRWDPLRKLQ